MIATGTEFEERIKEIGAQHAAARRAAAQEAAACMEPVHEWYAAAKAAAATPEELEAVEAEFKQRRAVCSDAQNAADAASQAVADAAIAALKRDAFASRAFCNAAVIAAPDLQADAEEIRAQLLRTWPEFVPPVFFVHSFEELHAALEPDRVWYVLYLVVEASDGALMFAGERRTLSALAAEWAPTAKTRAPEVVAFRGTKRGDAPTDTNAFGELLRCNGEAQATWREADEPAGPAFGEKCHPPGFWAAVGGSFAAAPILGHLAHQRISTDYQQRGGLTLGPELYFDNSFAGLIDRDYARWLLHNNPGRGSWVAVALALLAIRRPDITVHQPARQEFEEIKSDSVSGRARGEAKVWAINSVFVRTGLPYIRGRSPVPPSRIDVYRGSVPGINLSFEVTLKVRRHKPGLITYQYCVTTDWDKVKKFGYAAILALLIILAIIASRGRLRWPPGLRWPFGWPNPFPLPATLR